MGLKRDFERLRNYARRRGIGVRFVKHEKVIRDHTKNTLAWFSINGNQIFLSDILKRVYLGHMIHILAHEIGHALDFDSMTDKERKLQLKVTTFASYYMKMKKKPVIGRRLLSTVRKEVLYTENVAFDIGEDVLRHLSIRLSKKLMVASRKETINAYGHEFKNRPKKRC
jgi:Tfp pilus assembly protein PilZ